MLMPEFCSPLVPFLTSHPVLVLGEAFLGDSSHHNLQEVCSVLSRRSCLVLSARSLPCYSCRSWSFRNSCLLSLRKRQLLGPGEEGLRGTFLTRGKVRFTCSCYFLTGSERLC